MPDISHTFLRTLCTYIVPPWSYGVPETWRFQCCSLVLSGNRCAVDKTIEETFMHHSKSRGGVACAAGLTGIQANYSAYQKWCWSTKQRAKYLQAVYGMADMVADSETGTSHRDMHSAEKQRGERLVNETVTTVENFLNSPGAEGGPVCNHMSPNFDS